MLANDSMTHDAFENFMKEFKRLFFGGAKHLLLGLFAQPPIIQMKKYA